MTLSQISKFESDASNSQTSYIFDVNKFSPSLKLMNKLTCLTKNLSSPFIKSITIESPTNNISNNNKISNAENKIIEKNIKENQYYISKPKLYMERNAELDESHFTKRLSKSNSGNNINKLSLSSSYLLHNYLGKTHDLIDIGREIEENETKSNFNYKFKKLNQISSNLRLSNETYFTPYHLRLYTKILSKVESFQSNEIINCIFFLNFLYIS